MSEHCFKCGKKLNPVDIVWLEFDNHDNTWHDPLKHEVTAEHSQGAFPFGRACAKTILNGGCND